MKPAVLLLLGALALCGQETGAAVEGSVVNSVSGAGIEGVGVQLFSNPVSKDRYRGTTDATGTFQVSGIKPGDYGVMLIKRNFTPSSLTNRVHIEAGTIPKALHFELDPPATLRGRVSGNDGKPAASVEVALGPAYQRKATTGEDGTFVFDGLQPGAYSLMAHLGAARTYFPSANDPALAEFITVRAGADQDGFDIRLQTAVGHRVRGTVLDSAGKPAPGTLVQILPGAVSSVKPGLSFVMTAGELFPLSGAAAGVPAAEEPDAVSGDDGAFEFPAVRERDWIVRADATGRNRGTMRILVREDIDDLRIHLNEPFDLPATIVMSDGSPLPAKLGISLRLIAVDGMSNEESVARQIDERHPLRVESMLPGRYRVEAFMLAGNYYAVSAMAGALTGAIDVSREAGLINAATPLRIILKAGGTIRGAVPNGVGAGVIVVPQTMNPGDIGRYRANQAGGTFEFSGLAPGDYYAIAVSRFDMATTGVDQVRAMMSDATAVRIEEGETASVELKAPAR